MLFEVLTLGAAILGVGVTLLIGTVFITSVFKAPFSGEAHASDLTGKPSQSLRGDYPDGSISGKGEALQNGMTYDRRARKLILQGKLSNEYIDDLVG